MEIFPSRASTFPSRASLADSAVLAYVALQELANQTCFYTKTYISFFCFRLHEQR
jgi:hypothetical protein